MLFVPLSHAAVPWDCPAIATPADASSYRSDAGLVDVFDGLQAEADAWVDESCAWAPDGDGESCTTDAGAWVRRSRVDLYGETKDGHHVERQAWTLEVILPEGRASWTILQLGYDSESQDVWHVWDGTTSWSAVWYGEVPGAPADSSFTLPSTWHYDDDRWWTYWFPTWSGCAPSTFDRHTYEGEALETVTTDTVEISVTTTAECDVVRRVAAVDGVDVGSVADLDWTPDDADGDTWGAAEDCDDTDASVRPCGTEVALDGIDQDCDGADLLDGDGDGWESADFGGDDCDESDPAIHPTADDLASDGTDQDCDGHDDVDADGDGYTADGDDEPADCDEQDSGVHPGAREIPYDGIDQNCTGSDLTDADGDRHDAVDAGGDDCDDTNRRVYPGADDAECDGLDADCDDLDGACDTASAEAAGGVRRPPATSAKKGPCGCGQGGPAGWIVVACVAGVRRRRGRRG